MTIIFICCFCRDFEKGSGTEKCGFLSKAQKSAFFHTTRVIHVPEKFASQNTKLLPKNCSAWLSQCSFSYSKNISTRLYLSKLSHPIKISSLLQAGIFENFTFLEILAYYKLKLCPVHVFLSDCSHDSFRSWWRFSKKFETVTVE